MATARWHDWDRRVIGWFLVGLVVLVVLVGDPRGDRSDDTTPAASPVRPTQLCGSLDRMSAVRDDLVDGSTSTTVADLRAAATRTRDLGRRTRELDAAAEAGLEYFTGLFLALPDRPTTEQLLSSGAPASLTDQAHADALVSWLQSNCPTGGAATTAPAS